MKIEVVSLDHDLSLLVKEINDAQWDDANEISVYDEASLRAYLEREDTVFVACHNSTEPRQLMGIASSRIEMKPYNQELWLYVDEVDVCADQRQKGAGKAIMEKLIAIAEESGCEELWLGTEVNNLPANALYESLNPDDVAQVIGYTYETDEDDD